MNETEQREDRQTAMVAGEDQQTETGAGEDRQTETGAGEDRQTETGAGDDRQNETGAGDDPQTGEGDHQDPLSVEPVVPQYPHLSELKHVFYLSIPLVFTESMVFLIGLCSTVFCGVFIGATELASAGLAIAVINIFGIAIGIGLSQTFDTLISQTTGSGNLKRSGEYLQRGILITLLCCFPCWAFLINTEPILVLFSQNPKLARLAQQYVNVFLPALPATFLFQLQMKYLQNQKYAYAILSIGIIINGLNALMNYLAVLVFHLGLLGSAAAMAISHILYAASVFAYIIVFDKHKKTWSGWSIECLEQWGSYGCLAFLSVLMLCFEFWVFEFGTILAGWSGEVELGAQSALYQINVVIFMVPLGIGNAGGILVGQALGAGNIEKAKITAKVSVIHGAVVATVFAAVMAGIRHLIGKIFTHDQEILDRVAEIMLVFSLMHILDAVAGVTAGLVRGLGKQKIGVACNSCAFWLIGGPICGLLWYYLKIGVMAFWIAIIASVTVQSIFLIIYMYRLDWEVVSKEARERAGVSIKDEVEMEIKESQADGAEIPKADGAEIPKADGAEIPNTSQEANGADISNSKEANAAEIPSSSQEVKAAEIPSSSQEVKAAEIPSSSQEVKAAEIPSSSQEVKAAEIPSSSQEVKAAESPNSQEASGAGFSNSQEDLVDNSTPPVRAVPSLKQLLKRRALVLLIMVSFLTVGIVIKVLLMNLLDLECV